MSYTNLDVIAMGAAPGNPLDNEGCSDTAADRAVSDDLASLAGQINSAHHAFLSCANAALRHGLEAGDLLNAAKTKVRQVHPGGWLTWVEANCEFSVRTAQAYMRIAANRETIEANAQRSAHLSLDGALKLLSDKAATPKPSDAHAQRQHNRFADRSIEDRRDTLTRWPDLLFKYVAVFDAAGWDLQQIVEHTGMPEDNVRRMLDLQPPARFDSDENGLSLIEDDPDVRRRMREAYRNAVDAMVSRWLAQEYESAAHIAELEGYPEAVEPLKAMAAAHERKHQRLSTPTGENVFFNDDDDDFALRMCVIDDARETIGTDPPSHRPLRERFDKYRFIQTEVFKYRDRDAKVTEVPPTLEHRPLELFAQFGRLGNNQDDRRVVDFILGEMKPYIAKGYIPKIEFHRGHLGWVWHTLVTPDPKYVYRKPMAEAFRYQ